MSPSTEDRKIHQIALLIALACILQISESMIPHPIPGLRLGLANIITLTTLVLLGFRHALEVAVIRTVLSSLIVGTFMSPGFILSFAAAVASTLVMGFFYWLSGLHARCRFSIIGISIVGAFCHNMVQLVLAYLLLVKHGGIFVFFPWLSLGALGTGWLVGIVTAGVCRRLAESPEPEKAHRRPASIRLPSQNHYQPGNSPLHRATAGMKISVMVTLAVLVLIFDGFWFYSALAAVLIGAAAVSRTPFSFLFSRVRRYASLIAVAFFFPVFFNSGTHILISVAAVDITHEGVTAGARFAARIIFLIAASTLLLRTTSPDDMTSGLTKLLSPLRHAGISDQRFARLLSLSWNAVPYLWDTVREHISIANLGRAGNLRNLLPLLSGLIARLYAEAGSMEGLRSHDRTSDNTDPMEVVSTPYRTG